VILEPLERSRWPEGFWDAFPVDPDFKPPEALPSKKISLDEWSGACRLPPGNSRFADQS